MLSSEKCGGELRFWDSLTEPYDVRTEKTVADFTSWRPLFELLWSFYRTVTGEAFFAPNVPMELDHVVVAGPLMKAVDILRYE